MKKKLIELERRVLNLETSELIPMELEGLRCSIEKVRKEFGEKLEAITNKYSVYCPNCGKKNDIFKIDICETPFDVMNPRSEIVFFCDEICYRLFKAKQNYKYNKEK